MPLGAVEQKHLIESYKQRNGEQDEIIKAFNSKYAPTEILERNSYKLVRGKYLSQGSTSGNPGVTVFTDVPLIYSHHGDALGDGQAHDAFDVFAFLEHDGNKKAAYEAAGRELGLWRDGTSVSTNQPDALPDKEPWEPLLPLPAELPEVPTLPTELIPEPLREWIDDAAERTNVYREFIAVPTLTALGALIGRSVGIYPKQRDNWLVVPNVWGAIVGNPSVLKSPSIAEGTAPLRRLAAQAREAFEAAEANCEAEVEVLKLQIAQLKKTGTGQKGNPAAIKGDLTALLQRLKDLEDAGTEKRYLTNDATIEKLGELLIQNPRGLLSLHDELMGLLKTFNKPGRENERPFYLTAWNGTDSASIDRIGRGSLYVPALTLSILGGIQPGKLKSYIYGTLEGGEGDDGLLQRFQLVVWPDKPPAWENVDRYPKANAKNRAFDVYQKLDHLDLGALEEIEPGNIPALRFSSEAQALFNDWRADLVNRIRTPELERPPAFMAHLAKYPSLCASLALMFHLVDVVGGKASGRVSLDAAEMAVDWCAFLKLHAKKMYAPELNTAVLAAHVLAERIRQCEVEDAQPLREVQRRQWTGLKNAEQLESALAMLKQCNWLRVETLEPSKQGGRPSDVLRLHPELRGR